MLVLALLRHFLLEQDRSLEDRVLLFDVVSGDATVDSGEHFLALFVPSGAATPPRGFGYDQDIDDSHGSDQPPWRENSAHISGKLKRGAHIASKQEFSNS